MRTLRLAAGNTRQNVVAVAIAGLSIATALSRQKAAICGKGCSIRSTKSSCRPTSNVMHAQAWLALSRTSHAACSFDLWCSVVLGVETLKSLCWVAAAVAASLAIMQLLMLFDDYDTTEVDNPHMQAQQTLPDAARTR